LPDPIGLIFDCFPYYSDMSLAPFLENQLQLSGLDIEVQLASK